MLFMSCKCVNVNNLALTGHGRGLGGSLTGERDLIGHFYQVIILQNLSPVDLQYDNMIYICIETTKTHHFRVNVQSVEIFGYWC